MSINRDVATATKSRAVKISETAIVQACLWRAASHPRVLVIDIEHRHGEAMVVHLRDVAERAERKAAGGRSFLVLYRNHVLGAHVKGRKGKLKSGVMGQCDFAAFGFPGAVWGGFESKTETGRQDDAQELYERIVTAAGGFYRLFRSADEFMSQVEETLAWLEARARAPGQEG